MSERFLVSVDEAARQLGMPKSSLYRLAACGHVPCYKAGPKLTGRRFDVSEIREALRLAATTKQSPPSGGPGKPLRGVAHGVFARGG